MVILPVVSEILGGGGTTPPEISETTENMTMKFLPDVKLSEEARNQKKQDKYTMDPALLNLSQQFCQSTDTFWTKALSGPTKKIFG